jgi:hypothetical protein
MRADEMPLMSGAKIDHLLAKREWAAFAATRISPPDYIVKELRERPADPTKRRVWDRVVRGIEGYRQRNNVVDRGNAVGRRPESGIERGGWESQRRKIREAQRQVERMQQLANRERKPEKEM